MGIQDRAEREMAKDRKRAKKARLAAQSAKMISWSVTHEGITVSGSERFIAEAVTMGQHAMDSLKGESLSAVSDAPESASAED